MGLEGLALGFEEDGGKQRKKWRNGLEVGVAGEIGGATSEREKESKKKDRRKGVEGAVDCVLGSEVGEGRDIEESKDFDEKGSGMEVVDGESGKKKKKEEEEEEGNNESDINAPITSTEDKSIASFDKRKRRRGDGSDEPGNEDDGHSRDNGKKDTDDGGKVKKRKKRASNDAVVFDNELRQVLSLADACANSSVKETKITVGREERERKEKKKRNQHVKNGDLPENKSAQGNSVMFLNLGEIANDALSNDINQKRKKRKKGK